MPDIAQIIASGAANPLVYLPLAIVLGALHALEPGHSKSMMAAFIVAVRGTPGQAVLLGVSAAIGHTIVVWLLAALGLWLGDRLILDRAEPWLVLVSGLLIVGMGWRIFAMLRHHGGADHEHDHRDDHGHHHDDHGPDHDHHDHHHDHDHPHPHSHDHDHDHEHDPGDAHAAAHAREIRARFGRSHRATAVDIAWFGFTGGLLPCPAAIAVLLVCLQLKQVTLGIAMVAAFSVGLAITLVGVGLAAAWGTRALSRHSSFDTITGRLPYVSAAIVTCVGLAFALRGVWMLVAA